MPGKFVQSGGGDAGSFSRYNAIKKVPVCGEPDKPAGAAATGKNNKAGDCPGFAA